MSKNPMTPAEWQEAVDAAQFMLVMDAAKQYGLIESDIKVDAERCEEVLRLGKLLGFAPQCIENLCRKYLSKGDAA